MSTTTIRLDDRLKARVAAAAERVGKTPREFILDATWVAVEQSELADNFHRIANKRWAKILATGETVSWDDMRTYLENRARELPTRSS